jgi:hypothetical protein
MPGPAFHHAQSRSAQPLLHDFDISKKDQFTVSPRSLEDGDDSRSELEALRVQRRSGFWRRLRMSMRRRRHGTADEDGIESVRLGGEEMKKKTQKLRWRKRSCLALPVLIICIL